MFPLLFLSVLLAAISTSGVQAAELPSSCEVSVVGAGIGGVYFAWRLAVDAPNPLNATNICIFEAKGRAGGRILSVDDPMPGFEGYNIDLGAYRFHRATQPIIRSLTEDVLGIQTLCYTDPLNRSDECVGNIRRVVTTRGRVFGVRKDGKDAEASLSRFRPGITPYEINPKYRWGPGEALSEPRSPYSLVLGPDSIIKEVLDRFEELNNETSYRKAMKIADEIISAMRNGTYRGMPYSEVSLLQAAMAEGFTTEELQFTFDTGFADNFFSRLSLEQISQLFIREFAQDKNVAVGLRSLVMPVENKDGVPRRIGMRSIVDKMLEQVKAAGVRVFYGAKVTGLTRVRPGRPKLRLSFADGSMVATRKVALNIGKPDLMALGLESEPIKSSDIHFRRAVERNFVTGASKTYCFWEDAWWFTKLGIYVGRARTAQENLRSIRYHDGHVTCRDSTTLTDCRGALLVSYSFGDSSGAGMAIHTHSYNEFPYTPLTNTDALRTLIPGNMTGIEQLYFDDLVKQLRRVHRSTFKALGMNVDKDLPDPEGCVFADWRDVGVHTDMGPGKGSLNKYALFAKPVPDLMISLVNEAWTDDQGWAEGSVRSAERALFHHYDLARPAWLDKTFHQSVIRKYNQG